MSFIEDIFKGGAEGIFSGVSKIIQDFKADPTKVVELETAVKQAQLDLAGKLVQAESAALVEVNRTMQIEAASKNWVVSDWRPVIGWTYGSMLFNNYVLMPYLAHIFTMQMIVIPDSVVYSMMALLGVTTLTTGAEKIGKVFGNGK